MDQFSPLFLTMTPPELKPIYDVVDYPRDPFMGFVVALVITGIVGVLVYFVCRYIKNKKDKLNAIPPHVYALNALNLLLKKDYIALNKKEEFFTKLSQIVRVYIEQRFDIHAPDMTTEEFLNYVRNENQLNEEDKRSLKEFMQICDQVKFARFNPDENTVGQFVEVAKNFVERTKDNGMSDA